MTDVKDLCVVTGQYQDPQTGQTKNRYQKIGAMIDKGDGPFLVIEPWFNPAGVAKDGRCVVSVFDNRQG
jgi:hypothetical protein